MGYHGVISPKNSLFLVTGGAGFIGSNPCEVILKPGYRGGNPGYEFVRGVVAQGKKIWLKNRHFSANIRHTEQREEIFNGLYGVSGKNRLSKQENYAGNFDSYT